MKRVVIAVALMIVGLGAYAQSWTPAQYTQAKGQIPDSVFRLPRIDTIWKGGNKDSIGALVYRPVDTAMYLKVPHGWKKISLGIEQALDSAYSSNDTLNLLYSSGGILPVRYPSKIVSNVNMLPSIPGDTGVMITVRENGRGGVFVWSADGAANGGTKYAAANGIWNRVDTSVNGVYNVKWWGAKGDYDLSSGTNDAGAIQACADYLASIKTSAFIPTLYFPDSRYYLISSPVTVAAGISVIVNGGDIVYNGPNTQTALTIGTTGQATSRVTIRVKIRQRSVPAWTDPNVVANNVGVRIINAQNAKIEIPMIAFFCNNIVLEGNNTGGAESGFAYNNITIGTSLDALRHLTLTTGGTVGWINENKFNAGNFQNSSSTSSRQESRYGITIKTNSSAIPNNNIFYKPCFQLGHSSIPDKVADSAIAIVIEKGNANNFYDIRSENSGPTLMVCKDVSFGNYAYTSIFGLDNKDQIVDRSSSRNNHVVSDLAKFSGTESGATLIFNSGFLPDKINKYDATTYYIQGVSWTRIPDAGVYPAGAGVAVSPDHIGVHFSQKMGVFVDTRTAKKFALKWDVLNEQGGRVFVRLYDGAGTVVTDSTLLSPAFFANNPVETYGGGFATGTDNPGRYFYFAVDTSIKKIYVAISGGTDSLLIKSWQIYSLDNLTASVYSGLQEKGGFGQAAIAPTEVKPAGTIIYNDFSIDTTVLAWQNVDGGTLWSPIYRGEANGNIYTADGSIPSSTIRTVTIPTGSEVLFKEDGGNTIMRMANDQVYFPAGIGSLGTPGQYFLTLSLPGTVGQLATRTAAETLTDIWTAAGSGLPIRTVTTDAGLLVTDYTLICNNTGGTMNVSVPSAASRLGKVYIIKKISGSGNDVVIIDPTSTIDGAPNYTLTSAGSVAVLQSDGVAWYVIGH